MPLSRRPRTQRGFSLIEIMVGVAIGLIGIVVIFQVLEVWEQRKRTTSSGSDAQIAGSIAMFNMDRDLKLAGFGFGSSTYLGCTVQAYDANRATPAFTFTLAPAQIADGAAGAPDTVTVLYGSSSFFSSNAVFNAPSTTPLQPAATSKQTAQGGRSGFQNGELALVTGNAFPPGNCALVEVTGTANPDGLTLHHDAGAYTNYLNQAVTSRYNAAGGTGATFTTGTLFNLGPAQQWIPAAPPASPVVAVPRLNTWQIRANASLAWNDALHDPATWNTVAEGIVNLQAEYGTQTDVNVDGKCDSLDGAPVVNWGTAAPAPWSCLRALRVGVLARGQQYERLAVYSPPGCVGNACTPPAPQWAGSASPNSRFVMTNADGTPDSSPGDANDWRHYRYRVYQQVIPLRNMIWQ